MANDVFSKHVFPKYTEKKIMKSQMNGFDDPTLCEFTLLDSAAFAKEEYKGEQFEKEFIRSFLSAAKSLADDGRRKTDTPGMHVFYQHSFALPVLFLTRHCMELSLKRAIKATGKTPGDTHGLDRLWSSLLSTFPQQRGQEDQRVIKNMGSFVKSVSQLDPTGFNLRYSEDKQGRFTQDKPLFVNNEALVSLLEQFVDQLERIDSKAVSSHSSSETVSEKA